MCGSLKCQFVSRVIFSRLCTLRNTSVLAKEVAYPGLLPRGEFGVRSNFNRNASLILGKCCLSRGKWQGVSDEEQRMGQKEQTSEHDFVLLGLWNSSFSVSQRFLPELIS